MFWELKGSCTNNFSLECLLRLFGIHQHHQKWTSRHDYHPGASKKITDYASHLFHLSEKLFLARFNHNYPQTKSCQIVHPSPELVSVVILALCRKTCSIESLFVDLPLSAPIGESGFSYVIGWYSTPYSKPPCIKYPSFKFSSIDFDLDIM